MRQEMGGENAVRVAGNHKICTWAEVCVEAAWEADLHGVDAATANASTGTELGSAGDSKEEGCGRSKMIWSLPAEIVRIGTG
jgi:hypothetical protein